MAVLAAFAVLGLSGAARPPTVRRPGLVDKAIAHYKAGKEIYADFMDKGNKDWVNGSSCDRLQHGHLQAHAINPN
jgi:hypothetical protein